MGEAGRNIESLLALDPPLVIEAWFQVWGWYRDAAKLLVLVVAR